MSSTFLANSIANQNPFKQLRAKLSWRSERIQLDKIYIEAKKKIGCAAAREFHRALTLDAIRPKAPLSY
jgi:hypothetical protein